VRRPSGEEGERTFSSHLHQRFSLQSPSSPLFVCQRTDRHPYERREQKWMGRTVTNFTFLPSKFSSRPSVAHSITAMSILCPVARGRSFIIHAGARVAIKPEWLRRNDTKAAAAAAAAARRMLLCEHSVLYRREEEERGHLPEKGRRVDPPIA